MSNKEKATKISWLTLAFMAFSTVWGFGNITNGFVYFNGPQVIFSWIFMFVLYFIPYALMVGELGSAFKNEGGGVSSWLHQTTNAKLAYYAGWTYWACHITYIASKGSGFLKALSWAIFRNAETYDSFPTRYIQLATFCILLLGCYIASLGLNPLKKLLTAAGTCTFVMSLLYIVMMFAAPAINPTAEYVHANLSFSSLIPNFNVTYFTSLSILVFAVGGCEKISPYVNKVENPSKGFPRGMIALAVMVVTCAILGTLAMPYVRPRRHQRQRRELQRLCRQQFLLGFPEAGSVLPCGRSVHDHLRPVQRHQPARRADLEHRRTAAYAAG